MNSNIKMSFPIFIIILFLSTLIIPSITAETKLIKDNKSDLAKKHIIYIMGSGLSQIKYNEYCYKGPLGNFYRFYGFNGSYVRFSFDNSENILIIKDGIPRNIKAPVELEFGLSDPNTFTFLMWFREGKSFALSYCLYIIINQKFMV